MKKIDTFCSHCCAACFGLIFSFHFYCGSQRSICFIFFLFYFEQSHAHKLTLLTHYHRIYWGLTSCCSSQLSSFLLCFNMYDEDVEYTSCGHIFEIKINIFSVFLFQFFFFSFGIFYYPAMGVENWVALLLKCIEYFFLLR